MILSTFHELSYLLAFVVIIFLSSREYYRILKQNNYRPNDILGVFLSVLIFITSYLYSSNGEMWGIYFILIPILPIVCLSALYSSKSKDAIKNVSVTFFGILYISLPLSLMNFIVFEQGSYDSIFLLSVFIFLWASESAAFIGGSLFGKTKLFESVSPMKTWEGVFSGFFVNMSIA